MHYSLCKIRNCFCFAEVSYETLCDYFGKHLITEGVLPKIPKTLTTNLELLAK